jgi:hypothetical protein
MPTRERLPRGFLARSNAARMIGVSLTHFDLYVIPLAGPKDALERDGRKFYNAARLFRAWRKHVDGKKWAAQKADPLLVGPGSAGLERYRLAKAKREELAYKVAMKNLVDRREMDEVLGRYFSLLRKGFEAVQRSWPEAWAIMDAAAEEAERGSREYLQSKEFQEFREAKDAADAREESPSPHAGPSGCAPLVRGGDPPRLETEAGEEAP